MGRRVLVFVVSIVLFASVSLARTWYITPAGTGDAPTIQAGVDSASAGDEVVLADGTFTGDGNRDIDFGGKNLTIRSESGDPQVCVIDCQGSSTESHRAFHLHSGEDNSARIEGITVQGGRFNGDTFVEGGGAIRCHSSSPTISGCVFSDNRAWTGGGILFIYASPRVLECVFVANSADIGSCIVLFQSTGSSIVSGCVLANSLRGHFNYDAGSAIHVFDCDATISDCTFYGNSGAVTFELDQSSTIDNTIITACDYWAPIRRYPDDLNVRVTLSCCDVWGNDQGDWVGFLADQLGVRGNLSACPSFCSEATGDFSLCDLSPCLPGNHPAGSNCGLIGALGQGCICGPTATEPSTWGGIKSLYR